MKIELERLFKYTERQAQLPRARVELSSERGQNGTTVVKSDARRLGVSCSALFGLHRLERVEIELLRGNSAFLNIINNPDF